MEIKIDQIEGQEFFDEVKNKYPCLKSDVRIHKWPGQDNNVAFGYIPEKDKANVFDYGTMTKLNDSGITLLNYCNGKNTTIDIINEIINNLDNINEEEKVSTIKKIAKFYPLEQLITETDSPFLSPFPGKDNIPQNVKFVLEEMSKLRGMSIEEIDKVIEENCRRLFRIF